MKYVWWSYRGLKLLRNRKIDGIFTLVPSYLENQDKRLCQAWPLPVCYHPSYRTFIVASQLTVSPAFGIGPNNQGWASGGHVCIETLQHSSLAIAEWSGVDTYSRMSQGLFTRNLKIWSEMNRSGCIRKKPAAITKSPQISVALPNRDLFLSQVTVQLGFCWNHLQNDWGT